MSPVWLAVLAWAVAGPVLLLAAAPLLDGIGRRVRARLESRRGPPLMQGYVDLAKLAGKQTLVAAPSALTVAAPYVALGAAVAAGLLVPIAGRTPLGFAGDAVVIVYLLGLSSAAFVLGGTATGSPYSFLGASRELLLLLFVEPVVASAFFVVALKSGTLRLDQMVAWQGAHGLSVSAVLAGLAVFLALLAYLGRVPFDLSEAEQELMGGVLVEFGGRPLALYRWTMFVRWLVVAWLVGEVFLPTPVTPLLGVPLAALKVLLLFGVSTVLATLLARLRVDHARIVLTQVALLILFAITFAMIGA